MQQQAKSKWADHWDNQRPHHSQLWTEQVDEETKRLAKQLDASTVYEIKKNDPHFPDSRKTVDLGEEYDGMLLQEDKLQQEPENLAEMEVWGLSKRKVNAGAFAEKKDFNGETYIEDFDE